MLNHDESDVEFLCEPTPFRKKLERLNTKLPEYTNFSRSMSFSHTPAWS